MGREILDRYRASYKGKEDIHTRLMRRYKDIPSWWFYTLLIITVAVSLVLCIFLNDQVQMPWWGLLFAAAMAFAFTLPISIITATTNQVSQTFAVLYLICSKRYIKVKLINISMLSRNNLSQVVDWSFPCKLAYTRVPDSHFMWSIKKTCMIQNYILVVHNRR